MVHMELHDIMATSNLRHMHTLVLQWLSWVILIPPAWLVPYSMLFPLPLRPRVLLAVSRLRSLLITHHTRCYKYD